MNIGCFYEVKHEFWLLFNSKEEATKFYTGIYGSSEQGSLRCQYKSTAVYWSTEYGMNISTVSPNSLVLLLAQDGEYKKFLSVDGTVGWTIIYLIDQMDYFKEITELS